MRIPYQSLFYSAQHGHSKMRTVRHLHTIIYTQAWKGKIVNVIFKFVYILSLQLFHINVQKTSSISSIRWMSATKSHKRKLNVIITI